MKTTAKTKITIEATINASLEKVWNYWTESSHIINWNFASEDWHCSKAENDLQVGGKMNTRMEAKDGSFGFDFEGKYDEVILNKKITFTMSDGRIASTDFEKFGDKTKVKTIFDAEIENPIEIQKGGWQAILNNFKKYTENN